MRARSGDVPDLFKAAMRISGSVSLSGFVHVVTRVVPAANGMHLFTVYANLPANVSATGTAAQQEPHFIAHGASRHANVHTGLIIPCVMPGFTLLLADPSGADISPVAVDIDLELEFDEDLQLVRGGATTGPRAAP